MNGKTRTLSWAILTAASIALVVGVASAKEVQLPPLETVSFDTPKDNTYLPMAIGKTYVYESETEDGLVLDKMTHTHDTKLVQVGTVEVVCHVVRDVEWIYVEELGEWKVLEDTYDWFAWDNDGNVWYFGEDTEAYTWNEDWTEIVYTSTEGSWEAGVDGAEPGILMLAEPRPGLSYRQEFYEGEAEDMAKVLRLNAKVSVESGDYDDCLVTKEYTKLDPGNVEHKYYAPDVGLVFIQELKEKTVQVELVEITDVP